MLPDWACGKFHASLNEDIFLEINFQTWRRFKSSVQHFYLDQKCEEICLLCQGLNLLLIPSPGPLTQSHCVSQHQGQESHRLQWYSLEHIRSGFLVAQRVKRLPAMQETWVQSLGREDPLEKEMATHSSTLAWDIPWTEKPGRLQSMGSQRVGHDCATSLSVSTFNVWGWSSLNFEMVTL